MRIIFQAFVWSRIIMNQFKKLSLIVSVAVLIVQGSSRNPAFGNQGYSKIQIPTLRVKYLVVDENGMPIPRARVIIGELGRVFISKLGERKREFETDAYGEFVMPRTTFSTEISQVITEDGISVFAPFIIKNKHDVHYPAPQVVLEVPLSSKKVSRSRRAMQKSKPNNIERILELTERTFDTDIRLQGFLQRQAFLGNRLYRIIPQINQTSIFVFEQADTKQEIQYKVLLVDKDLNSEQLTEYINQNSHMIFVGVHLIDSHSTYLVVFYEIK
jgi:hypothetical protein